MMNDDLSGDLLADIRNHIALAQAKGSKPAGDPGAYAYKLLSHFLSIVNRHISMNPMLAEFVDDIQYVTRCSAVGIRILDSDGNIPYQAYKGFSEEFFNNESPLSVNSDHCMCINVIKGDYDCDKPFYSRCGSFFMNGTTKFLATVSEKDKGQTRNECNRVGYESVALLPIRTEGTVLGLIHIADQSEGRVPEELVVVLELVASQLASGISRIAVHEKLSALRENLETLVCQRTDGIATTNELLKQENEDRKMAEKKLSTLNRELQESVANIRTLRGLLPICSSCKKVRDDKGYWQSVEDYIETRSMATFSHGVCPECLKKQFPDEDIDFDEIYGTTPNN